MTLYDKLLERKKESIGTAQYYFEESVLSQILLTAFQNDSNLGELPDEFEITGILYSIDCFETLLKELDMDVLSIEMVRRGGFASYKVRLKS